MRCVIWHGATAELPGELLNSLSKRMLRMTVCTDAYSAVAHCALIERTRRAEIKAGSIQPLGGVLVLVQPAQLARLREAIESLHVHGPSVALWAYDRSANPKLRAVVDEDVASWTARMPLSAQPARSTGFGPGVSHPAAAIPARERPAAVGLGGPAGANGAGKPQPAASPQVSANESNRGRRGASLLTEEELRMLLAPDPREAGRTGQRRNGTGGA
ncbi:MAG TPA: hypothetical protein VHC70_10600 [Phycisphaerales bacterium]|jgi:hypothetical protein|nr:hypothetical protein [Phycisphaerales bacterium]